VREAPVALNEEAFAVIRASSGKSAASRLLIGAGALALLIPAIAGCEAGTDAPTLQFHPASTGAHIVFNGIRITNVFVLAAPAGSATPAGSDAGLFLSMYNGGGGTDKLVSISAPGYAASGSVTNSPVALPLLSAVNLTGPQPEVVLTNLSKPLRGGQSISVKLTFEMAGSVTLQVPVEAQSYSFATFSPAPATPAVTSSPATPTASPTATAKPTASATPTR
jgi:copper(I)-binding protein